MHTKKVTSIIFLSILCLLIAIFIFNNLNRYEKLPVLNSLSETVLEAGTAEMKKHKILIMGITRDNAKPLPNVIKHIEHTGAFFKDYKVIVFENDSKDGTKEILQNWQGSNPRVKILSQDFDFKKRISIAFLAQARNYYITEMSKNKEYDDFDVIMILDLDLRYGWDLRGTMDSFSKFDQWDAVCSNGITKRGRMNDMFAFRNNEFPFLPSHEGYWGEIVPRGQKRYSVGDPMVPVHSCFGAMAFYKREAIEGCVYGSIKEDCEHVLFHECVVNKNNGRMFMNPSQVIRYSIDLWTKIYSGLLLK